MAIFNPSFQDNPHKNVPQKRRLLSKLEEPSQQTKEGLKKKRVGKFRATFDFSIKQMLSHQVSVAWLKSEVPFFHSVNISNHIQKWEKITNGKFSLNIIKNVVSKEFRETTAGHYVPRIKFLDSVSEIIDMEIAKILKILFQGFSQGPKKMAITE